jgi:hypothetical protein
VRKATGLEGAELFAEAQRLVRWHYQWIVTHDFLDRIAGRPAREAAFAERRFFTWENAPYMPVEFSGAAYRYGHSQVREAYDLNEAILDIRVFADADKPDPLEHLGGFRRLPAAWTVDWSFFFKTASRKPQLSRKIDSRLSPTLFRLPIGLDAGRHALAQLNLRRGRALGLPSGQDVAGAMGVPALTGSALGLDAVDLPAAGKTRLKAATPLWYYLLREAEAGGGEQLGAAGATIVAEVLVGLLQGDPLSYARRRPDWKPELPGATAGDFTMADLAKFMLGS